jgi:diguanylate cyclase (GGDEF)-like protein/PAS domain S-box-containing protein
VLCSGRLAAALLGGAAVTLVVVALLVVLAVSAAAVRIFRLRVEHSGFEHESREAQLRTVQYGITEAIQVFDADGILISRNPAADRIFELAAGDLTREALISKWEFIREDRTPLPKEQRPLGRAMLTGVTAERVVVGIRKRGDGTIKWLSMSTFPIRGDKQELFGYVSCAWDVTEATQTNRELEVLSRASAELTSSLVSDEVIRALTRAAGDLCSAPGERRRRATLLMVYGSILVITGEEDPETNIKIEGVHLPLADHPYIQRVIATREAIVAELDYGEFGPAVAKSLRDHELKNCVWVPLTRAGSVVAILAVGGRQEQGLVRERQLLRLKTLASMGELALSNAEAHEEVARLARTDPLTGLGNRRALADRLDHLPRTRYALLALDVDDLKKVNDVHGHPAGDELLAKLAGALAAELRPSDLLARMGGDEFVALLADCDAAGAVEFGKRLSRTAARLSFPWGTPSISVGSAAGGVGDPPEDVSRAADEALYAAKQDKKVRSASASAALAASS